MGKNIKLSQTIVNSKHKLKKDKVTYFQAKETQFITVLYNLYKLTNNNKIFNNNFNKNNNSLNSNNNI
jgi:hypothetical protein